MTAPNPEQRMAPSAGRSFRRWHRWRFGPLCWSFYVYFPRERMKPFSTHSWRYVGADGEGRHAQTFKVWRRNRKRVRSERAS